MSKKIQNFKQEQLNTLRESNDFLKDAIARLEELEGKQKELYELFTSANSAIINSIKEISTTVSAARHSVKTVSENVAKEPITEYRYEVQYQTLHNSLGQMYQSSSDYTEFELSTERDNNNVQADSYTTSLDMIIKDPDDASGFQNRATVQDEKDRHVALKNEEVNKEATEQIKSVSPMESIAISDTENTTSSNSAEEYYNIDNINLETEDSKYVDTNTSVTTVNSTDSVPMVDSDDSVNLDDFNDVYENTSNSLNSEENSSKETVTETTDKSAEAATEINIQEESHTEATSSTAKADSKPIPVGIAALRKNLNKLKI